MNQLTYARRCEVDRTFLECKKDIQITLNFLRLLERFSYKINVISNHILHFYTKLDPIKIQASFLTLELNSKYMILMYQAQMLL